MLTIAPHFSKHLFLCTFGTIVDRLVWLVQPRTHMCVLITPSACPFDSDLWKRGLPHSLMNQRWDLWPWGPGGSERWGRRDVRPHSESRLVAGGNGTFILCLPPKPTNSQGEAHGGVGLWGRNRLCGRQNLQDTRNLWTRSAYNSRQRILWFPDGDRADGRQ